MTAGYVERRIDLTLRLGKGSFGESGFNTYKATGLRTFVSIVKAGGLALSGAQIRVQGLPLSVMNQLATLGVLFAWEMRQNTITVEAGDDSSGMSTVFQGGIKNAWIDNDNMPDTAFDIEAFVGAFEAVKPALSASFPGTADVATILGGMAKAAGLAFENNGVDVKLSNPYFSGSVMAQIQSCAEAANIDYIVDNNTLIIWPRNQSRNGPATLVAPPPLGNLVGYPRFTSKGLSFRTMFTPSIGYGSRIQMQSSLTPANGTWIVYKLAYNLEAQEPDGAWFCDVEAAAPGFVPLG